MHDKITQLDVNKGGPYPHVYSSEDNIPQFDGSVSILSDSSNTSQNHDVPRPRLSPRPRSNNTHLRNNAAVAHHLPTVTVCNMRSLFPKLNNFKIDLFERQVDVSLLCEIWQKAESKKHRAEIENMLEIDGLK